jgi:hypothetical protein
MLKQLITVAGFFFVIIIPLAAQTASTQKVNVERTTPINDYTPENKQYQKDHKVIDYTGISKDPQYRHATTAADEKAKASQSPPAADSTAPPAKTPPVDDKQKPKN